MVANYTVTDEHGATDTRDADHHAHRHQRRAGGGRRHQRAAEDDTIITGSVATNDSDVDDGDTRDLSYTLDAPVAGLTLNANGSYSFDAVACRLPALAGRRRDARSWSPATPSPTARRHRHRTLTITVTGTNDAPVAVADTNAGLEDSTITGYGRDQRQRRRRRRAR